MAPDMLPQEAGSLSDGGGSTHRPKALEHTFRHEAVHDVPSPLRKVGEERRRKSSSVSGASPRATSPCSKASQTAGHAATCLRGPLSLLCAQSSSRGSRATSPCRGLVPSMMSALWSGSAAVSTATQHSDELGYTAEEIEEAFKAYEIELANAHRLETNAVAALLCIDRVRAEEEKRHAETQKLIEERAVEMRFQLEQAHAARQKAEELAIGAKSSKWRGRWRRDATQASPTSPTAAQTPLSSPHNGSSARGSADAWEPDEEGLPVMPQVRWGVPQLAVDFADAAKMAKAPNRMSGPKAVSLPLPQHLSYHQEGPPYDLSISTTAESESSTRDSNGTAREVQQADVTESAVGSSVAVSEARRSSFLLDGDGEAADPLRFCFPRAAARPRVDRWRQAGYAIP